MSSLVNSVSFYFYIFLQRYWSFDLLSWNRLWSSSNSSLNFEDQPKFGLHSNSLQKMQRGAFLMQKLLPGSLPSLPFVRSRVWHGGNPKHIQITDLVRPAGRGEVSPAWGSMGGLIQGWGSALVWGGRRGSTWCSRYWWRLRDRNVPGEEWAAGLVPGYSGLLLQGQQRSRETRGP